MSGFASTNDMAEKQVSFDELGPGLYAYTAEGDPNSGIIVGPDGVVVVDAQATPLMAQDVQAKIATVTDRKVKQIVLSHYHAVRVLGATGYPAHSIIASDVCRDMIVERGQQDMDSEIGRFPRLFRGKESIPGLTWPTQTFHGRMTLWLGDREAQIIHIGRAHTAGDTIVHLPAQRVVFTGDVLFRLCTPIGWEGTFAKWTAALDRIIALDPAVIVPGHGPLCGLEGPREMKAYLQYVRGEAERFFNAGASIEEAARRIDLGPYAGWTEPQRILFNVARAYRELRGEPYDAPIDAGGMLRAMFELRAERA